MTSWQFMLYLRWLGFTRKWYLWRTRRIVKLGLKRARRALRSRL